MVHTDVKVDNVLLKADGSVVLADFALCRSSGSHGVYGTACMEAPECRRNLPQQIVHFSSDSWALGCVVIETLALQTLEECVEDVDDAISFLAQDNCVDDVAFLNFLRGVFHRDPTTRWLPKDILESVWLSENVAEKVPDLMAMIVHPKDPVHFERFIVVESPFSDE
jgi:serine/threonine protein kinase